MSIFVKRVTAKSIKYVINNIIFSQLVYVNKLVLVEGGRKTNKKVKRSQDQSFKPQPIPNLQRQEEEREKERRNSHVLRKETCIIIIITIIISSLSLNFSFSPSFTKSKHHQRSLSFVRLNLLVVCYIILLLHFYFC